MKKSIIVGLALLFIGFAFTAAKAQTENDIFGYYTIQGNAPVGFTDISEIHLAGDYGAQQNPQVHGLVRLKSKTAKDFAINKPTLSGKNITFTTKAVGGISYQFTGTFVKFPNNTQQAGTVLRGVLRKFKGKTKIAEANVKFSYEAGD
jgi:hypothetical protein